MKPDRRLLVGIDGGTQSTKVIVFDVHGHVVAQGIRRLRPLDMPAPGVAEHPDDDLWASLKVACQAAMVQLDERRNDIVAVGLCSIRFCRALLRADSGLAAPVLNWMDERVGRAHQPTPEVARVTAASAYLTARLTGEVVDSVANYAGIWPVDHQTWDWSTDPARIAAMGVTPDLLPRLVLPGDVLGTITTSAATATGLPAGLPVVATGNDKAVEALGNGLLNPDQLMLSLGTYITAMRPAAGHRPDSAHSWSNFAAIPHRYLDESTGIRRGMATLSWLRDLLSVELTGRARADGVQVEDVMNAEAADVPPGSQGLLTVLDWLAPTDAPHRRGAVVGFDARHGWPQMYRSVLEGIAMTMKLRTDRMADELHRAVTSVLVAGGGSASDPMMQIVADVFDVPASRCRVTGGAGLGAAICAAVAVGVHDDFEQACREMVDIARTFVPDREAVATYAELIHTYAELSDRLDEPFRQIHQQRL